MKNYKFRAWDNRNKKWLMGYEYPNLGGFSLTRECVLLGEWSHCFDEFLFEKNGKKSEDLIITQFIGLSDVNGKPLYSGDILCENRLNGVTLLYKIFSVKGGFAINTHQDDFKKEQIIFYESTADMQTSTFIEQSTEKIGNIFDNPEYVQL